MIFKGLILSIVMCVLSILLLPFLICRIPEDYFLHNPSELKTHTTPLIRGGRWLLKNVAGYILVLAGIIMLFVPGQGLLTILLGAVLMDFPGKRQLENRLIGIRRIRNTLNWIRKKYHVNALKFP
ncbi:PGPGW domain-containing protein [Desulfocicer niacini]